MLTYIALVVCVCVCVLCVNIRNIALHLSAMLVESAL